jgi:hypothetical protein
VNRCRSLVDMNKASLLSEQVQEFGRHEQGIATE